MTTDPNRESGFRIDQLMARSGLTDAQSQAKRPNKRGELTRSRIVKAAESCFAEYGYSATRITDITHRAGTAPGNFYRHFANLDEVFVEVLRPGLVELAHSFLDRLGPSLDVDLLSASMVGYLDTYARHRSTLRLLREAAAVRRTAGFQELWLSMRAEFGARIGRWLEQVVEAGVADPDLDIAMTAELLACMTEQLTYVNVGLPHVTPRREEIERLGRGLALAWSRVVPGAPVVAPGPEPGHVP